MAKARRQAGEQSSDLQPGETQPPAQGSEGESARASEQHPAESLPESGASASVASIVSSSLSEAPAPSEGAIEAHTARQQAQAEEVQGKPRRGNPGGPRAPYKKREVSGSQVSTLTHVDLDRETRAAFRKVGFEIADSLILGGIMLGGEDWQPKEIKEPGSNKVLFDERANLREAWADMAEYYQWGKFPAWVGVLIATGAYVGPRLNAPSTQSRLTGLKMWWAARKAKKAAQGA